MTYDFVPPIYRDTVIETGIYPTLVCLDIEEILEGKEPTP